MSSTFSADSLDLVWATQKSFCRRSLFETHDPTQPTENKRYRPIPEPTQPAGQPNPRTTPICVTACVFQGAQIVQLISDYREMLARRRQNGSTTATADDTESAQDAPTPTGNDRRSPTASPRRSRAPNRPATTSSGAAVAAYRRRLGTGRYATRPPLTPTSSPEPDAPDAASKTGRGAAAASAGVPGKTQFKYKRVKDSVRQPAKRGHLQLASRKSDARHEGIFD